MKHQEIFWPKTGTNLVIMGDLLIRGSMNKRGGMDKRSSMVDGMVSNWGGVDEGG